MSEKEKTNKMILDNCSKEGLAQGWFWEFKKRKQLEQEIDRLNNIISELEKWINKNLNDINAYFENTPFGVEDKYKEVLDKLKELKEDNKDV